MLRKAVAVFVFAFSAFMVIGRLISGVHWATDIVASVILSAGLFMLYRSVVLYVDNAKRGNRNKDGVQ
jgi:undecaprenyl-diphosphatase